MTLTASLVILHSSSAPTFDQQVQFSGKYIKKDIQVEILAEPLNDMQVQYLTTQVRGIHSYNFPHCIAYNLNTNCSPERFRQRIQRMMYQLEAANKCKVFFIKHYGIQSVYELFKINGTKFMSLHNIIPKQQARV